ncbi:MAG: PocR ligand-binding domain-containing protein [Oscillospiraceae bacterium]
MENELYLTDLIDVEFLQQIQDAFSDMTGMAALTADKNGVAVTKGSNFSDFCVKYTRMSERGNRLCSECDKNGAEKTLANGGPCAYYCHAGLVDYAAPIMADGKMVGSFIGGQVLPNEPDLEKTARIAEELGIDPEEYKEAAKRIKIVSKESIDKAAHFLYVVANVLSEIAYKSYCLHKVNLEVEKASHLKSDFLANMSHEIRTPMNAVLGMTDLALREEMSPTAREYLHQIRSSGKILLAIINDILDFSKIESGKMDIIETVYEPLSVINDLANIINSRIGNKKIDLTVDIAPDLPKNLFGDNIRIHQILLNLLNNAVKFTQQGEIRLTLGWERSGDDTILLKASVKDTGIGIKQEDLHKLFNSFQQVDSKRNRNIEGTGLGLAISQRLLQLMGGTISVESEYNKGSTFSFELPQKVINDAPAVTDNKRQVSVAVLVDNHNIRDQLIKDLDWIGADISEIAEISAAADISPDFLIVEKPMFSGGVREYAEKYPQVCCLVIANYDSPDDLKLPNVKIIRKPVYFLNLYNAMGISNITFGDSMSDSDSFTFVAPDAHILIVDDNSINLTVAKGLINPLDMQVDTAASAAEAIEMMHRLRYDLIFMDHMMPEVDGVEATHIIRRLMPNYDEVPIIALTANAVGGVREMFIKEGMNDFVAKPIEVSEIVSKLRKWLPQEKILPADRKAAAEKAETPAEHMEIAELNTKNAISLLGSEELYRTVLKEYYLSIDSRAGLIREHKQAGRIRDYTIEVHSLKSTSKQIGADKVSALAAELERAGNDGDIGLIDSKTDELLEEYVRLKNIIRPCFPECGEGGQNKSPAEQEDIIKLLDRMCAALDEFDILGIEEVLDDMAGCAYPAEQSELYERLREAAESSDLDFCHDIIGSWRAALSSCE